MNQVLDQAAEATQQDQLIRSVLGRCRHGHSCGYTLDSDGWITPVPECSLCDTGSRLRFCLGGVPGPHPGGNLQPPARHADPRGWPENPPLAQPHAVVFGPLNRPAHAPPLQPEVTMPPPLEVVVVSTSPSRSTGQWVVVQAKRCRAEGCVSNALGFGEHCLVHWGLR